ncbi:hypothetical protein EVAR_81301_1 [Eumeta japonica]|uniref:Uncharacterized protein n=1 Tax=Eumeta variegata TaxID=151549 RepID=A0A4C1W2N5_EUMVA|nr:hypothetical protein EVAR_81301_1 [Eumeta japonica]
MPVRLHLQRTLPYHFKNLSTATPQNDKTLFVNVTDKLCSITSEDGFYRAAGGLDSPRNQAICSDNSTVENYRGPPARKADMRRAGTAIRVQIHL